MLYDAVVVGLGAHGSATAYHLAKRGANVLGIERFARGHTLGSSGGLSRIIRLSYHEHPDYVPLLRRAWDLWRALEDASGEALLTRTGGLYVGPPDGDLVARAAESAREHALDHELLDADELRRRYGVLRIEDGWHALLDAQAGWLAPERCIDTHLRMAERHGATLRFDEPVVRWERDGAGVRVATREGSYTASRLVLTAGAWMPDLVPSLAPHLWVERSVLFWFEPRARTDAFASLPVWILEDTDRFWYGFPYDQAHGLKVAGLHFGERADPNSLEREPRPSDEERVRVFLRRRLPDADGERRRAKVCMYTNSPDGHFVIDALDDVVVYASACSGHGFKFASAIGELLAAEPLAVPAFLRARRLLA